MEERHFLIVLIVGHPFDYLPWPTVVTNKSINQWARNFLFLVRKRIVWYLWEVAYYCVVANRLWDGSKRRLFPNKHLSHLVEETNWIILIRFLFLNDIKEVLSRVENEVVKPVTCERNILLKGTFHQPESASEWWVNRKFPQAYENGRNYGQMSWTMTSVVVKWRTIHWYLRWIVTSSSLWRRQLHSIEIVSM